MAVALINFTFNNETVSLDSNAYSVNTSVFVTKNVSVGNVFLNLTNNTNVTPLYQILIDCSDITINGLGNTFDFSNVINYGGLIVINGSNLSGIIIQNVHILINGSSTLTLPYGGWICQGGSDGLTSVTINNCSVISPDDINIDISNNLGFSTGYCGIICGGGNGIGADGSNNTFNTNGSDGNGGIYSFNNCLVNAGANINFTSYQEVSLVGGICGGGNGGGGLGIKSNTIDISGGNGGKGNGGTYSFNGCQVNGTININGILLLNGIICGGINGIGGNGGDANGIGSGGNGGDASGGIYTFTDCSVNGNIQVIGVFSEQSVPFIALGGVCGGGNGRSGAAGNADISGNGGNGGTSDGGTYTFQNCNIVSPIFDISGLGVNMVGGICGGLNGFSGPGGKGGSITGNGGNSGNTNGGNYNYTSCNVTASTGISITSQIIISGGICGGENGQSTTGGDAIGSGNGGKSGNTIGGIYDFSNCSVTSENIELIDICGNRDINNTNSSSRAIIFGGICGGFNGSIGTGGSADISGNGGDTGNSIGGNYTFYNCNVISNNNIDISFGGFNFMGGICGGGNGGFLSSVGGSADNSGNGGSCGIANGGNYSFNLCNVSATNNIIMSGYEILSGCICGGGNGIGSGGGGSSVNIYNPSNTVNGGNGGNGYGGNYTFTACDVSVNNNIIISGYTSAIVGCGGICGGLNGSSGAGGESSSIGNGGNSGDASGGIYDFSSCSIKANNIEIKDISLASIIIFGGICAGGNGIGLGGGTADISGNGGNCGNCYGGIYTFQSCSVILNNDIDIFGIYILSGGICGGLNGTSLSKSGDSTILGNGGNGGNNIGGNYIFEDCYVIANNNINITGASINSGGICGGGNGSTPFLFGNTGGNGNGISGNGGNGSNGNGGTYTFNSCSIDAMNGNIQLNFYINDIIPFFCFYGGICGGVNGTGGNGGNALLNGTGGNGGNGGNGFSGIYDFSNCTVIAGNNIILPSLTFPATINNSGGICSGANGQPGSGGTGTQPGQNGSNVGGLYTFSICIVECCEFIYDGVIIEPPGTSIQKENGLIIGANQSGNTTIDNESYLIKTCNPPPPPPPPPIPPQSFPVCCPLKIYGNKPGTIFGGSGSGVQGAYQSAVMNEAQVLKNTAARLAGKTIYVNKQINVYGSYYGAPAGSGAPPRNSF